MERRVVVTGLGAITPIGKTVPEMWEGIKEGRCGIDKLTAFDNSKFKTKLASEIKGYDPTEYFEAKQAKRFDKSSQFALIAAREALKDSGITSENTDLERVGVVVSSGIGGIMTFQEQCIIGIEKGYNRISPMFIPMVTANMPSGNISIDLGLKGEAMAIVSACASGTHAIGEAYRIIKHGYEDAMIAGGTEAAICESGIAGFENIKAISTAEDKTRASIPFDKERSGFIMGEGAGVLVLEELEHAIKRGAKIYAELAGYGASADAYHITSPEINGDGGARGMKRAIADAKLKPEDVDYINAHGTSTHLNDLIETKAIKLALGEASKKVMVSSTKSNTGHLLGAAGGVEAIMCVKAIEDSLVPPTINYKEKDEECDLDIVPNVPRKFDVKVAISNSLGFGGQNASVLFKKYENN